MAEETRNAGRGRPWSFIKHIKDLLVEGNCRSTQTADKMSNDR